MEGFIEICGNLIEVKSIKNFRIAKKEYIFRPVFEELPPKNFLSSKKYIFKHMEPYAAIVKETNGGFLWQTKKYVCKNAAGREMTIELDEVPVLVYQADGHSSEVFKDNPCFALMGNEKATSIEYIDALEIEAKEDYIFYGNNIHLFSVLDGYNRVKQAVTEFREGTRKKTDTDPNVERKNTEEPVNKKVDLTGVSAPDNSLEVNIELDSSSSEIGLLKGMNYQLLIEVMNDEAFSFFLDEVFPYFHYKVMRKEDIRKIDIIENFVRIETPADEDWVDKVGVRYYMYIMQQYIETYLKCREGSEAEKYKQELLEHLEEDLKEDSQKSDNDLINDVEDNFVTFVSMFRAWKNQFGDVDSRVISEIEHEVKKEDAKLIKELWEHNELVPDSVSDKGGLFGFMKSDDLAIRASKLFFINNMIFLCHGLMKRGCF